MKVYLLYYDCNSGSREEWNTFYTPCEVFASDAERKARIDVIKAESTDYNDDECFYTEDKTIMTPEKAMVWSE